jgi:ribosomal-protein-alanine N-acetyltransferase
LDYKEIKINQMKQPFLAAESKNGCWSRQLNKGILVPLSAKFQLFIRWMNFNDIPFVCDLESHIFPSPWPFESFLYELDNRNYNISFVGLIGEELVAYAISYLVHDEIHISNLAVDPHFRRFKIGETMLWMMLQISKEKNCRQAHLEVRESNTAAISLYQKYGFQVVDVRKNYYQNEKENALLMSLKIDVEKIHGVV